MLQQKYNDDFKYHIGFYGSLSISFSGAGADAGGDDGGDDAAPAASDAGVDAGQKYKHFLKVQVAFSTAFFPFLLYKYIFHTTQWNINIS